MCCAHSIDPKLSRQKMGNNRNNEVIKRFCRSTVLCFACLLLLATPGCQHRNEEIAGVSIPIPENMTKNPDKGFVPIKGFEDGQVSYQGKVSPDKIFTFYQEVMEAKGWQPNTFFGPRENQIAYTKGNRVVLIAFTPNPDGTTVLTVMVGTQYPPK
jgi:hypothetical protein